MCGHNKADYGSLYTEADSLEQSETTCALISTNNVII